MKKFIILFASLFVILTPAVSYASCEDAGDCDNYINGSGQIFGDYEDCMAAPDTEIFGGGCEGIGGGDYGDWDDTESDGNGTFVCCNDSEVYPEGYSYCVDSCNGSCMPGEDFSSACEGSDETGPTNACAELSESECMGGMSLEDGDYYVSCYWDGDACAIEQTTGCILSGRTIDCDYLTKFIAGINSDKIQLDTSDGGQFDATYMNVCASGDTDCFVHMTNNWCAYYTAATADYFGDELSPRINLVNARLWANQNLGTSCRIPPAAALNGIDGACQYAEYVVDAWWSDADPSECESYSWDYCEDSECVDWFEANCATIWSALNSDYNYTEDSSATTDAAYAYLRNGCPTIDEKCAYLKGAFDYYNIDSCDSPCTSDSLEEVCSSFGAENSSTYNKCIKTLSNTTECNAITNHIGFDCGMNTYSYYDLEGILGNIGTYCDFDTTRTDGHNCVIIKEMLNDKISCWDDWDEDTGEEKTVCSGNFDTSVYPDETIRYLNRALNDAVKSGRIAEIESVMNELDLYTDEYLYGDALYQQVEQVAQELGITCRADCDWRQFYEVYLNNDYSNGVCNIRTITEVTSDPVDISRALMHCEAYNRLNYEEYDSSEGVTDYTTVEYLGCYNNEHIDDVYGPDCEFAKVWYDYMSKSGSGMDSDYCNVEDICASAYTCDDDSQEDCEGYYRCIANLSAEHNDGTYSEYEQFCETYWWHLEGGGTTTLSYFMSKLGLSCVSSCGEGEYLKRGQCYDCKLPTSKHTKFFAGYEAGTKNCAHTYNTIEDKGLKIHDLKCELAEDMKNWKCTVNALECGGGYHNPNINQLGLQVGSMDEYDDDVLGFDSQGRPYVESDYWGDCDKWIYGEDYDICAKAVDFVYAQDPWGECGEPDYTDEGNEVYPCTLPISARAIDMLACNTPVPAGYYGFTRHMQDSFDFDTKGQCSKGYYQDKTGQTSCKRCPQYNIKSTNGTTVFGTTSSYASTSASACYIDSMNYFRGKNGKYHFTPQCNYD